MSDVGERVVKVTIEFGDDRRDEVIDVMFADEDNDAAGYCVDTFDHTANLDHVAGESPIALVERAIFKLRRAGLK